ncbi:MAG: PglZ domain-containing protein, partial [Myxococcales bacterium]|nr:PglZ domain-containing protein [Myxococcales bacterium]
MHAFHKYLCDQLDERLAKSTVVVFYDPRKEFEPFFDRDLEEVGTGYDGLPRVFIKERLTFIARSNGSLFAVRAAVEPIAQLEHPEPLIVYMPGVERDRHTSILMELEKGGTCYEPQVKRLARNVLRKSFTDAQIDKMLDPPSVGYDDVVSFLRQTDNSEAASVLRAIFDGIPSEALLTTWLADDGNDDLIERKEASAELLALVDARLGLALPVETEVADAREKTARYVLINEFRFDLGCDAPPSTAMIPEASKEQAARIRDIAESLRRGYSESYVHLADRVDSELGLAKAAIPADALGNIDTFRFEEEALLRLAGELVEKGDYTSALGVVSGRNRSFWVDRDVARQAQWEACRLMAELGREIENVRPALAKAPSDAAKWVHSYAAEDGWFRGDALQRRLEAYVAKMDEEPEAEKGFAVVRREHEELLKKMADGFATVLSSSRWTVPGALHQTRIYPDVVQDMGGRVAYFFVDAMRFE